MAQYLTKKELSIIIGNILDHFDTSLYGFLAPTLAPIFFPNHEPIIQLILTYSIVITSLFTRPLGVFIFGNYAKNHSPALGLSYSLIGVAITSFGIGCIPSHTKIGLFAPFILIALRMIRSFFASGEVTIARLYIMEGKEQNAALRASHLYQSSSMIGPILASAAATVVNIFSTTDILWRVCFWCGGIAGISGYILRRYVLPQHKNTKKISLITNKTNLKVIWQYKRKILCIAITTIFSHITYVIPFIFMNSFIPLISNITLSTMLTLNTILLIINILLILLIGRLLTKFNPKKILLLSSLILACTILPILQGLNNASIIHVTCVRLWFIILGVIFVCPLYYWYKKILDVPDNYLLIGIGTTLGAATLGRMTTAICLSLWYMTGTTFYFAIYLMIIAFTTAYAISSVQ